MHGKTRPYTNEFVLTFVSRFVVVVELCERFTYYGLSPPFQNYIQNGPNDDPQGYLGLGQQGATGLGNFFQFWYVDYIQLTPF